MINQKTAFNLDKRYLRCKELLIDGWFIVGLLQPPSRSGTNASKRGVIQITIKLLVSWSSIFTLTNMAKSVENGTKMVQIRQKQSCNTKNF